MVRHWDSETGEEIFAYPAPQGRPAATEGGRLVLVPALGTPTALLIDTTLRAELGAAFPAVAGGTAISVSAQYFAVETFCGPTARTSLLDADSLEVVDERTDGYGMALSLDGARLAHQTASADGDDVLIGPIEIVQLASWETVELGGPVHLQPQPGAPRPPAGLEPGMRGVSRSALPDPRPATSLVTRRRGTIAVVDGLDGYFAVWNARDGHLIRESLSLNQGLTNEFDVFDVAFSADLRLYVSRTAGRRTAPGTLESISTTTWTVEPSRQLALPGLLLELAGVSADGSTLFGVSGFRAVGERALYWFDTQTLEDARPSRPRLHEGSLLAAAMSSDRSLLATGSSDGFVRVWDTATGHLDHEIPFVGRQVDGLAFVTDTHLAVILDDGSLRLVTIDSEELAGPRPGLADPRLYRG